MGFFDEVDSIVINNKEVQSIISSDGGVIYEKSNGYELTLTSDKSIIQTGESATLSATLTNNNVPMAGETIFFYDSNNPPITRSSTQTHTLNVELGSSFKLIYQSSSTYGESIRLSNEDDSLLIEYSGYNNNIYISINGGVPVTAFSCEGFLKLENGVLSDDGGHTYNLSSYNLNFKLKEMQTVGNNCSVYINPIGSAVTDANGVASVSYVGKGVGDITVQADWNNTVQSEIYSIEDCTYYDTTEYTSNQNLQVPMPSGDFCINAELMYTSSRNAYPQLYVGTELNVNNVAFGQMREGGNQGFEFKKNNTRLTLQEFNSRQSVNTWYHIELKREGDLYTLIWNNDTLTYTDNTVIIDYLFLIYLPNGHCKNVKIKPL